MKKRSKAKSEPRWVAKDTSDASSLDWHQSERVVFQNLKPSTATISLRLPLGLLARIKAEANRRDVPYQSYLKMLLADALDQR